MIVRVLLVALTLIAATFAPGTASGAPAETCDALVNRVKASLNAERQRQLEGATDSDGPAMEFEPALRACYRDRVLPALKRAEADDARIPEAWQALTQWGRAAQLQGFSETHFDSEWRAADSSLTLAFKNGYTKAAARCAARSDVEAANRLVRLYTGSAVLRTPSDTLFPHFQKDVAKCRRSGYFIQVVDRVHEGRLGLTKEIRYLATVTPSASDPTEFTGVGSYGGFVVSTPNCVDGKFVSAPIRLRVGGTLEPTASIADMSAAGGAKSAFSFVLATRDWPFKPMFFSARDAVATGEDLEGVAGMGTTAGTFLTLTDPVTVINEKETTDGGQCIGTITTTSEIRIERLGGR